MAGQGSGKFNLDVPRIMKLMVTHFIQEPKITRALIKIVVFV